VATVVEVTEPQRYRYWKNIVATSLCLAIALAVTFAVLLSPGGGDGSNNQAGTLQPQENVLLDAFPDGQ
jgi:hypothetical protein